MREYIFHGKSKATGEWVEGYLNYCPTRKQYYIMGSVHSFPIPVYEKSIGQYTGICDKNGRKIFEGDIILKGFERVAVKWNSSQCRWGIYLGEYEIAGFNESTSSYFEVVGAVFENADLLEG